METDRLLQSAIGYWLSAIKNLVRFGGSLFSAERIIMDKAFPDPTQENNRTRNNRIRNYELELEC